MLTVGAFQINADAISIATALYNTAYERIINKRKPVETDKVHFLDFV